MVCKTHRKCVFLGSAGSQEKLTRGHVPLFGPSEAREATVEGPGGGDKPDLRLRRAKQRVRDGL